MEVPALLKNKSLIWSSVGVLVLLVGIFVALQLIPQEQDIRQEAAVQGGTGQVRISPTTMSLAANEEKIATVQINTNGRNIRTLSAVLSFPFTGSTPPVTAQELVITPTFSNWTCDLKSITQEQQQVMIVTSCRISAQTSPAGYTTGNQFVDFFTFKVKGGTAATTTPVAITFNTADTIMGTVVAGGAGETQDIAAIPTTNLRVTVTAAPPAEKKITVTAPTVSCTETAFTVSARATEGTANKSGIELTFKYNNETKTGTTNDSGQAAASFTKASSNMNVTVEATGYTAGSAAVNLPTDCDDDDDDDSNKKVSLSLSGLACGPSDFTATADLQNSSSVNNKTVTFTYNNETKTATTNSSGEASVRFNRASSNQTVRASATDFDSDSETATLPTGCSTSGTATGASCNQSCTASRDCRSGLSCVSGYCRAPQCSSDTSCGCADVDVAAQNGTTQLPESGFDQTLAMTILGLLFLLGGGQLWWSRHAAQASRSEDNQ